MMLGRCLAVVMCLALVGTVVAQNDLPVPEVIVYDDTAPGDIYLAAYRRTTSTEGDPLEISIPYANYLLRVNNAGEILFQQRMTRRYMNFQSLGAGRFAYYYPLSPPLRGGIGAEGVYRIIDAAGDILREVSMVGHATTFHEFLVRENGNIFLLSSDVRLLDMTAYDGMPDARVYNVIIQEINPAGEVVWEWDGWEHFSFEDSAVPHLLDNKIVDFVHANSLEILPDGDILLSSKRLDEITKIDYETGQIVWRMGGVRNPNNEFIFIDDVFNGFSHQHMPQWTPQGTLLLFDNGNLHDVSTKISRAVEYEIDETNRTATLVWSYEGSYAAGMGSVQRLANGNTLIGWGSADTGPAVTEVTPEGRVVFELYLPPGMINYRAYRLE